MSNQGPRILVVDDQQVTLDQLSDLFAREGYQVDTASDAERIEAALHARDYDVVFTDLQLGVTLDGLDVLSLVKELRPRTQVVIMTAFSSIESSLLAMRDGAYDYVAKPFNREELLLLAARAAEKADLERQVLSLSQKLEKTEAPKESAIIGRSPAILQVMRLLGQVARTDATVLVVGESGTGKELVAAAVHQWSPRANRPFVAVNCGAIPENLQESEFFGHVKGAFTGAIRTKIGLFEQAHHGTLFLDEIGDLSPTSQVKVLRFLQSGEVRKVGDNTPSIVDVRLVAATNRDLQYMVAEKTFREDLYYRLNIICIEVPALREREGDTELLANYFLAKYSRKLGNVLRGFRPDAMDRLRSWSWPGNVRELENAVERAVTLARGPYIEVVDLPRFGRKGSENQSTTSSGPVASLPEPSPGNGGGMPLFPSRRVPIAPIGAIQDPGIFPSLAEIERGHIRLALETFGGHRLKAAKALGISKATLWRKMREYGWM